MSSLQGPLWEPETKDAALRDRVVGSRVGCGIKILHEEIPPVFPVNKFLLMERSEHRTIVRDI